jgi:hypothetical protein
MVIKILVAAAAASFLSTNLPYSVLALAAAAAAAALHPDVQHGSQDLSLTSQKVERALTLWATGTITIEAVKPASLPVRPLPSSPRPTS